jgi:zinc protease
MSHLRAFAGALIAVVVAFAQPVVAQQASFGITDARTGSGIRLVHLQIPGENTQSFAFAWADRHVLHNIPRLGLQSLAPTLLLTGGSTTLDGGAIEEDLKDLGVQVALRRTQSFTLGEWTGPPAAMAESGKILKMVAMQPRLPPKSLERSKRLMANSVAAARERNDNLASLAFARLLIGEQPLGALYSLEPLSRVTDVTPDDVDAWRRAVLARNNLTVVAAGPLSRAEAERLVDDVFGGLPESADIKSPLPFTALRPRMTVVIERPGEQSVILMGQATRWNGTTDGQARGLAMTVLGGGSSSRLFVAIREKLGAAYGAQAGISPLARGQHRFTMQASVANDRVADAVAAMRDEYARFRDKGVSEAEIEPIRKRLVAQRADAMRRAPSAANLIRSSLLDDLLADYVESFGSRLAAATAETVNKLINQHLGDDLLTLIITPSAAGLNADCVVATLEAVSTCSARP